MRSFFGPVFFYDLVRSSRRGEQAGHRFLYALVLFCVLAAVYWSWFPDQTLEQLMRSQSMSKSARARFASQFFASFIAAQFVVVLLITPLYTASAIAEQKERRTFDFVLVTDLTDREIILGTLGARLAKLLLLVMTGLPVLSLLEFLGGIDPGVVLATFVATCMLMASLGSLSILASVHARTALGAVVVSYVVSLAFFGLSTIIPCLQGVHELFLVGKPRNWMPTQSPIGLIMGLIVFSSLHGVVALVCCRNAIAAVRRVALEQAGGTGRVPEPEPSRGMPVGTNRSRGVPSRVPPRGSGRTMARRDFDYPSLHYPRMDSQSRVDRPPVGADALLWKELYADGNQALAGLRQLHPGAALGALALLLFLVACFNAPQTHGGPGEYIQGWVRRLEIVLSCILLLIVALSASGRVSRERERRTLDNLLMLPVGVDDILFAKWLGSIWSVSRLWWLLGPIWALGLLTGALNLFAVPLLIAAIVVFAAFVACLGLWFSTVSGSTMRASLFTLLAALLFLAVPGALATTHTSSVNIIQQEPFGNWGLLLLENGLSPPTALWALTFRSADLQGRDASDVFVQILAALVGLYGYMAATVVFWMMTRARLASLRSAGRIHRRWLLSTK